MGWQQFERLVDPAKALAARQETQAFNEKYGAAIRAVRKAASLRQADIAGMTDRHLRRVELGQTPATKATLQALADSHGLSLDDYLKELARRMSP